MKFLNLNTGYSFDALWTNDQEKGYIFWFPNEQGIGITYSMPIAVITDNNSPLNIRIEDNDIFKLIELSEKTETIDCYVFDGIPVYSTEMQTVPQYVNGKYVHIFNVACKSDNANEYICKININDNGYIRVGADFYGEHEPAYINLSNMGVEIPTTVQKAIYDANVHEDITDNILINRKFKELLSNYWSIIANKGSYKSLINALKWFEWENEIQLKEIYKHYEADKTMFIDKDLSTTLNETIEDTFSSFVKTTYISLYSELYKETPSYDSEQNPILEEIVFKWSLNDIKLKLALLAKFFGLYFLPIHISILHATVESKVFTNTIKVLHANDIKRVDQFAEFGYVECSINDLSTYHISNVKDTFKLPADNINFEDMYLMSAIPPRTNMYDRSVAYYAGPGVVIPITLTLTNRLPSEFVKQVIIDFINDDNEQIVHNLHNIVECVDSKISMTFKFLAMQPKEYKLNFTFILSSSKILTKQVIFSIDDIDNVNINIYKIKAKDDIFGLTPEDFYDTSISKYFFRIQPNTDKIQYHYYTQYLPYLETNDYNYTGIKLNRTIVVDIRDVTQDYIPMLIDRMTSQNYMYIEHHKDNNPNLNGYITFISKHYFTPEPIGLSQFNVIKNELVFYPQFHRLERIGGDTIDDYTIKPYEALCCAVEISKNGDSSIEEFRYGHLINSSEWSFFNNLTNETNSLHKDISSQQPFIAGNSNVLKPGYYDITFKYSLKDGSTHEYKLDSAFRIKAD